MSELYIKVQPPASTEWQRPTEWLTMPTIESPSLNGLYFIFEDNPNGNALVMEDSRGFTSVDWGDNSATASFTANTLISHSYNYDNVTSSINVYTEDGSNRNYKQVIVKLTFPGANNAENFLEIAQPLPTNTSGRPAWAEINCNFLNTSNRLYMNNLPYLRIFKCTDIGFSSNPERGLYAMSYNNYKIFEIPADQFYGGFTKWQYSTFPDDLDLPDLKSGGTYSLRGVTAKSIGHISGSGTGWLDSANIGFCKDLRINSGQDLMKNSIINISGSINATATTFRRNFQNCTTRRLVFSAIPAQPSSMANNGGCFSGMKNLEEMIVPGLQNGFTIAGSNMSATALDAMFTSLGTANGSQTITVTGNPGAATCDTSIATNKGFTVVIS
tara:strand:+ start:78 stop:1232 length:1155 start_codon:yes stop_codon:yes gene_type:complete